jgi:MFS family permease
MSQIKKATGNLSKDVLLLYFNRLLVQIGFGFLTGFGAIFFYQKSGESIVAVLAIYSFLYFLFAMANHFSAKFIKNFGMRKMMIFSLLALIFMFWSRALWDQGIVLSLSMYFIAYTFYRAFYWVPYHVEFAKLTSRKTRGKQMAALYNVGDVFAAIIPFFSGLLISYYSFNHAFYAGMVFIVFSIIPVFYIKEIKEVYSWNLKRLIKEFFEIDNRPLIVSNIANGMQATVAACIWPIFVFVSTNNNYVQFGAIIAAVAVAIIVLRGLTGNYIDKKGKDTVLKVGSLIYFSGWIIKATVFSVTGIFIADVYHRFGAAVNQLGFDATLYDQAADNGHYIDEYTVLRETSFSVGRTLMGVLLIPLIIYFGIQVSFLLAAFATIFMRFASQQKRVS